MPTVPLRRRRTSEVDVTDDENEDEYAARRSHQPASSGSKRARTGHNVNSPRSASPDTLLPESYLNRPSRAQTDIDGNLNNAPSKSDFQPGAIVRVKVTNFITYEDAVFYPGPNLNMVIGPNGTGKSSLVCAICLGLGYSPNHLGRASRIGEFVKHGKDDATIEIELQRRLNETENHVVKVRIIRDGEKRKWWINGSETSLKAIQKLVRELGIQVDNLCQFLPQDRVSEFAGLNPVELLHETQRAAAPEQMLVWHDRLKSLRKEQKDMQLSHDNDREMLTNLEARQENLRGDVERLQQRAQIQERVSLLEKSVPFIEYRMAREQHYEHRQRKVDAQKRLRELEKQVEPTLRAVNTKQQYQAQIEVVVNERKRAVADLEKDAILALQKIDDLELKATEAKQRRTAELEGEKKRKQDLQSIQRRIQDLQAQLQNEPPAFDASDWNARIRAKEHRLRDIETEVRQVAGQQNEINQRATIIQKQVKAAEEDLTALDSQAGKQVNKLKILSMESARAWEWIQKNQDQFEKPIFGPPLVECSIKDPRYIDAIESLFQRSDVLSFSTQTKSDFKKLGDHLYGEMKLADINIKTMSKLFADARRQSVSKEQMEEFGLDGWAIDFIDGPDTVLAWMATEMKLDITAVALQDVSEAQYNMITKSKISSWVSGKQSYRTTRRLEYGPEATSTMAKNVRSARYWTEQPVDFAAKRDLQEKIDGWKDEFNAMREEVVPLRQRLNSLKEERTIVNASLGSLKIEKNEKQKAAGHHAALPAKIERETESLQEKKQQGVELRQRVHQLVLTEDDFAIEKISAAIQHKGQLRKLRSCHDTLLEAEFRLLEAVSDVEALKERNIGISQELERERQLVIEVERAAKRAKEQAQKTLEVCKVILADDSSDSEYFKNLPPDLTLESLQNEIDAEKSKLDYIHDGNAGALKEFELRHKTIEKLNNKIRETAGSLDRINVEIREVRENWEPELDNLIKEISDAFAYNFEQIGCAGEVGVHKDDDFDHWSIEIKVKFRENESLAILDQHRQSGGERSVSTIFYLLSLQSLARAPFRVVDEINQGMDPRNERMVHERMVEIACKEHTSQYFLITPKLLTGLKYDPRMKVLCIASGEHMPRDHSMLDMGRIIELKRTMNIAAAG